MYGLINNQHLKRILSKLDGKIFKDLFVIVNLIIFFSQTPLVYAQEMEPVLEESVNDLTIVAGSGGAGAILGLSTLSFAKNPGDNLNNILVGGSIGIIFGVALVAWLQASKPYSNVIGLRKKKLNEKYYKNNPHLVHKSQQLYSRKSAVKQLPFFTLQFDI